ncbi:biotin--[acetyl-CoA-carboxylase] ligase [Oceanobacillus bengalensis]|uniref:Bifunctional ligase/repressor BirA n=1 Tax=Oceanobacillus bengalensis TaxID=1435466 RepID=A0A494YV82_9BACI|nr:biotin--[acetyl-CoA-carboxylase] ligase [Oceanobacillus bengalensis]RKQ13933.1 biotin--[acetyl-CoA-carboxylase] ligase [Oceanobacillus bengalensis]
MSSTRNKLIEILALNNDGYISGQAISDKLQISRSAVWKHMKELEKDGYKIEGKSNKGYRIIGFPNKLSENTITWGLDSKWLGKNIIHKESTSSTQTIAHEHARNQAPNGTVIIADEQTDGRGRINRNWDSTKEKGIWMSIILRPEIPAHHAPQLTLLTATVLADVLSSYPLLQPQIKWPNDILLNGKKCAGILTEMQAEQDQIWYVIIGIGLNVKHTREDLSEELRHRATSLGMETEKDWSIQELIQKILATFEKTYELYLERGFGEIKEKWEHYGFKIGKEVNIKTMKEEWKAPFLGIAEDGAMLTISKDGHNQRIYSAEISWFDN